MKTPIRDFYGKIIAFTEDAPSGDIIVRDFYGKILGKYDKKHDVTRDFYGRIVAKGNQIGLLMSLDSK